MTIKRHLLIATMIAGCGNYSNEDVDFQLAVPEKVDLEARLPNQQALVDDRAAEYLLVTRDVMFGFNRLIDALTGVVDAVRSLTPSAREGDVRVWGPFANERDRRWEVRMRMTRGQDPAGARGQRFFYDIEFHRVGTAEPWQRLMVGTFAPGGGARRGEGALTLTLGPARAAGYPVAEFNELETLRVRYRRATPPHQVEMTIENVAGSDTPGAIYTYGEEADGAGSMAFVWRRRDGGVLVRALGITSRWTATGTGRADARVTEGLAASDTPAGTDCWSADGVPTHSRRDYEPKRNDGDPATCVF